MSQHEPPPEQQDELQPPVRNAALIGCGLGGCLAPVVLFLACAVFGDTGGPLFWPIVAVPLGLLGMMIGGLFRR